MSYEMIMSENNNDNNNNNNIFQLCNENVLYNIYQYIGSIKEFIKLMISNSSLFKLIPKDSQFYILVLKDICKDNLDSVLLRLGYSVIIANSLQQIDCFEVFRKLHASRKCTRSGCLQQFQEIRNNNKSCCYHSGRIKGQSLSCCRKKHFSDEGCKLSYHDGAFYDTVYSARLELPLITERPISNSRECKVDENETTRKFSSNDNVTKLPKILK